MKAKAFSLVDQDGVQRALKDYVGTFVLLYFYPKDMTPGCTVEAICFRDALNDFKKAGVQVLGVSADSVASHKKFATAHQLNFPLLSDPNKTAIRAYGVEAEKSMFGKKYMGILRDSFLINPTGQIVKHYQKVNPAKHAQEVLADMKTQQ
ncbi:TPA: thioredoxin-dependent thiol peroxidase [Candidatus Uhrbacteria bacterium]|nr:thioredoxin-dependent thiol peroxidase [Candidatus Uhrbacteria bacterium]